MNKFLLIFSFLTLWVTGSSQYKHLDVFKGFSGAELEEKLIENYKPLVTMSYGMARDTLYKNIDLLPGNKLECIYTGYQITLDINQDPTMDAFNKGINAEHSYPQSKGAEVGNGRSDLHHLYPSRENVNSDRGSHPYGESIDNETDFWYYEDEKRSIIPNNNIDEYSELDLNPNGATFEPRESVKGNIARGIFYFYTMYREEALNADPAFFNLQKEDLCQWHFDDPVDEVEWNRSLMIATYQENKANPFVLDCSLASRLYCDQISTACELLTPVINLEFKRGFEVHQPYPVPSEGDVKMMITSYDHYDYTIIIYDVHGNQIHQLTIPMRSETSKVIELPTLHNKGIHYVQTIGKGGKIVTKKIVIF